VDRKISDTQELTQTDLAKSRETSDLEEFLVDEQSQPTVESETGEIVLENLEQNPYEVSYSCLLLPRFPSHYLMGDIVDRLQAMMKQISVSFGWRLDFASIKPDYMQWVVQVSPTTSPTRVIHAFRTQTSMQIFEEFPRFKRENLSDDFWAPGYLVYWGSQPHPVEIIKRFIRQTRKQQGIQMDE